MLCVCWLHVTLNPPLQLRLTEKALRGACTVPDNGNKRWWQQRWTNCNWMTIVKWVCFHIEEEVEVEKSIKKHTHKPSKLLELLCLAYSIRNSFKSAFWLWWANSNSFWFELLLNDSRTKHGIWLPVVRINLDACNFWPFATNFQQTKTWSNRPRHQSQTGAKDCGLNIREKNIHNHIWTHTHFCFHRKLKQNWTMNIVRSQSFK